MAVIKRRKKSKFPRKKDLIKGGVNMTNGMVNNPSQPPPGAVIPPGTATPVPPGGSITIPPGQPQEPPQVPFTTLAKNVPPIATTVGIPGYVIIENESDIPGGIASFPPFSGIDFDKFTVLGITTPTHTSTRIFEITYIFDIGNSYEVHYDNIYFSDSCPKVPFNGLLYHFVTISKPHKPVIFFTGMPKLQEC